MAAAFHEVLFPVDISYGASGGPEYSTDLVKTASGGETRNQNWEYPLHKYDVGHNVKTREQIMKLSAFFRGRKGKAFGFRFKDWIDYAATGQYLGTGDGATATYQLIKKYTDDGGYSETRKITKPVNGTVKVYLDDVLQIAGYTVDYATGIVTFDVAPAAGVIVTADFEFDVPCRFDTDGMTASIDNYNVFSWASIPIVEIKV